MDSKEEIKVKQFEDIFDYAIIGKLCFFFFGFTFVRLSFPSFLLYSFLSMLFVSLFEKQSNNNIFLFPSLIYVIYCVKAEQLFGRQCLPLLLFVLFYLFALLFVCIFFHSLSMNRQGSSFFFLFFSHLFCISCLGLLHPVFVSRFLVFLVFRPFGVTAIILLL